MAGTRWAGLIALFAAVLVAGCGGDTTTVINETTTTVAADTTSTTDDATSTTSTTTDDDDSDDDVGEDGGVVSLKAFQSPSGNIACVMTQRYARCDVAERDWSPPAAPADCQLDFGHAIQLAAEGSASFVCAGDTVLNPDARELPYGSASQVGAITCESDEAEIECENMSGGKFSLSREEYDLN